MLQTEKSETALANALNAITHLATPENSSEIKDAFAKLMRAHGSEHLSKSLPVSTRAIKALDNLPPELIADFVVGELKNGNEKSRKFIHGCFRHKNRSLPGQPAYEDFWTGVALKGNEIASLLLERARLIDAEGMKDVSEGSLNWRTECLCILSINTAPHQETQDELIALLEKVLVVQTGRWETLVAQALASIHPKSKALQESSLLERKIGSPKQSQDELTRICWIAGRMGAGAEHLVPTILEAMPRYIRYSQNRRIVHSSVTGVNLVGALGEIGPDAKDAIPKLLEILDPDVKDNGSGIQAAARKALRQIQPDSDAPVSSETSGNVETNKSAKVKTETREDVAKLIKRLLLERHSIRQAKLDFTLKNTGKYASTKKYKWYFDQGNSDAEPSFRSDVKGFGKGGFPHVTEIYSADHYVRLNHTTGENQLVEGSRRGSNPIVDPRDAGLVSWFLESIDTHDDDEIMSHFVGSQVTDFAVAKLDENLTRSFAIVVYDKDYNGTRETVFDARQGNHPVLMRYRWQNPVSKENVVDTMEVSSKQFNGIWFPEQTIWHRKREGKEEFREVMTVHSASLNKPVDQELFELESLLSKK